jgi:hypothetical protein
MLVYKDPFIKKYNRKQNGDVAVKKTRPVKPQAVAATPNIIIHWNKIEYLGSIYNTSKKSTVASLRIDGVDFTGKQGEVVSDFMIMSILKDSVQLSFQNQIKYITKNK